jgi:hypothetical protein
VGALVPDADDLIARPPTHYNGSQSYLQLSRCLSRACTLDFSTYPSSRLQPLLEEQHTKGTNSTLVLVAWSLKIDSDNNLIRHYFAIVPRDGSKKASSRQRAGRSFARHRCNGR